MHHEILALIDGKDVNPEVVRHAVAWELLKATCASPQSVDKYASGLVDEAYAVADEFIQRVSE
jgi:hypothetical protein